jgi:hypothetical protein
MPNPAIRRTVFGASTTDNEHLTDGDNNQNGGETCEGEVNASGCFRQYHVFVHVQATDA